LESYLRAVGAQGFEGVGTGTGAGPTVPQGFAGGGGGVGAGVGAGVVVTVVIMTVQHIVESHPAAAQTVSPEFAEYPSGQV
jgi:hypothetical protein